MKSAVSGTTVAAVPPGASWYSGTTTVALVLRAMSVKVHQCMMLASETYAPPWRATMYSPDGEFACRVTTFHPSNSVSCTSRPRLKNHGGVVLLKRLVPLVDRLPPKSWLTTFNTRICNTIKSCTNDGSPVYSTGC